MFSARLLVTSCLAAWLVLVGSSAALVARAAEPLIPHGQNKPPNPAYTPEEAAQKMTVPKGFAVEVFAAEPDIVNPVAMTVDEQGRFWITESLEYPRRAAGPGRDRVKVLEDTNRDGQADKFRVFLDGLNIPSGVAVGYGGVWVANAPDILFVPDADRDGQADGPPQVVVTGFGRFDTHELPNSLTWGPDGYLYGLNGVFNPCEVRYPQTSPHYREDRPAWRFTCALFRIHPVQKTFEVFCEGTSNPWGVTWDPEGSAFISACVIDHLWHLTETGYYHRQGGPYPPFVWKIESIVKHKHQKAAYCGIHYFDSDAYPAEYRDQLYMGNIHGGCINVDKLRRDGGTYFGTGEPDFLTANDAWFMPVMQKTGPDGCLYILDWYDRYHCYQDANRDPQGIDRLKGRLYRVRYENTPRAPALDLGAETNEQLRQRLHSGNGFIRDVAQRLLIERRLQGAPAAAEVLTQELHNLALSEAAPRKTRLHALWASLALAPVNPAHAETLLKDADPTFRAWAVRAIGNSGGSEAFAGLAEKLARDDHPDVKLQVVIAAGKRLPPAARLPVLLAALETCGDDKLIPHIVWENLHPLLEQHGAQFLASVQGRAGGAVAQVLPRAVDRILAVRPVNPQAISQVLKLSFGQGGDAPIAKACLNLLGQRIQSRELSGDDLAGLRQQLEQPLAAILAAKPTHPLAAEAAVLAAAWGGKLALERVRLLAADASADETLRQQGLAALAAAGDGQLPALVQAILREREKNSLALRGAALSSLGRLEQDGLGGEVAALYAELEADLRPRAIELLTQRKAWGRSLLAAVAAGQIPAAAINVNQAQRLLALGDPELSAAVARHWGAVRTTRDPQREAFVSEMRKLIRATPGDAVRGQAVFAKVCGQCHKIYGQGQEVGPDITANGRASFEQLLSNVFDPSLVIGASYQARLVQTSDGRVLTGLLAEDSEQRIVLKVQGGKLETIARGDIEQLKVSELSLMPEGIEKQLKPQEIADLFAFITLDRPPSDPQARPIPGTREPQSRSSTDPKAFRALVGEVLPGFSTGKSGEGGVAFLAEHFGRPSVLRTHPLSRGEPCVLSGKAEIPAEKKARLLLAVAHDPRGDWRLIVQANGRVLHDGPVSEKTAKNGWLELSLDLLGPSGSGGGVATLGASVVFPKFY